MGGAFYAFMNIRKFLGRPGFGVKVGNSTRWCLLLEQQNVATVMGSAFGAEASPRCRLPPRWRRWGPVSTASRRFSSGRRRESRTRSNQSPCFSAGGAAGALLATKRFQLAAERLDQLVGLGLLVIAPLGLALQTGDHPLEHVELNFERLGLVRTARSGLLRAETRFARMLVDLRGERGGAGERGFSTSTWLGPTTRTRTCGPMLPT